MDDGAEDGIECDVQMLAEVLGKEAQDKAAVLLEQRILATVAAVGGGIGQVLRAVDLDGDLQLRAEQVDLDLAPAIEGKRQLGIEAEESGGFC